MTRILASLGLAAYVVAAAIALFWWAPHFFSVNLHIWPQANYRYAAATGIPFALLLIAVAARQSLLPRYSVSLLLQVLSAGLFLLLGLLSFGFLPQSVFFCAAHLALCAVFVAWDLFRYRAELHRFEQRRAALRA